jgi:hypothetical protein
MAPNRTRGRNITEKLHIQGKIQKVRPKARQSRAGCCFRDNTPKRSGYPQKYPFFANFPHQRANFLTSARQNVENWPLMGFSGRTDGALNFLTMDIFVAIVALLFGREVNPNRYGSPNTRKKEAGS